MVNSFPCSEVGEQDHAGVEGVEQLGLDLRTHAA